MIKTTIYKRLADSIDLTDKLARHKVDDTAPAIYEGWAEEDTRAPYICLTYAEVESDHWAKRESTVTVDVFTEGGGGTMQAEDLRNIVIRLLDRQILPDPDDVYIRLYLDNDNPVDENDLEYCHWQIIFTAIYWRESFYLEGSE